MKETLLNIIIKVLKDNELRLSDGYKNYSSNDKNGNSTFDEYFMADKLDELPNVDTVLKDIANEILYHVDCWARKDGYVLCKCERKKD